MNEFYLNLYWIFLTGDDLSLYIELYGRDYYYHNDGKRPQNHEESKLFKYLTKVVK